MKTQEAPPPDPTLDICTSGFSARAGEPPGYSGIVQAAHCSDSINRISADLHHMTLIREHYGTWGDVEFLTTDTSEQPWFFAETDEQREVLSVEEYADIHAGDQVCGFGRGGLDRHCRTVNWVNNQCDGLSHLVEVDADVMSPGDSGGPWFRNNRAIGIHHGPCGRNDLFSAVGNLPRALEAVIMMDE